MKAFQKILVPHDFSEHADQAVDAAADLARRYDASVTLIHVHDVILYAMPEGIVLYPAEALTELFEQLTKKLEQAKRGVEALGLQRVDAMTLQGSPVTEILRQTAENGYDLIVMGTHGRSGIKHAVIGSVAERVVRRATCPVLTVRAVDHRAKKEA